MITPRQLEMNETPTQARVNNNKRVNTFRTNPLRVIQTLFKAYNVKWVPSTGKYIEPNPPYEEYKYFRIRIKAMDIDVVGVGKSMRKAKRNVIFKLHKAYCNKCKTIINFNK